MREYADATAAEALADYFGRLVEVPHEQYLEAAGLASAS
jgi:hypothetical protein